MISKAVVRMLVSYQMKDGENRLLSRRQPASFRQHYSDIRALGGSGSGGSRGGSSQLSSPVNKGQIGLPADGDDASEDAAVLNGDKSEAEGGDGWPEAAGHGDAGGDGDGDAVEDLARGAARQGGLHAEEVGVECRGEEDLAHDDFGGEGEEAGGVVEVVG